MLVMKSGEKPNLKNYSVFFETLNNNSKYFNMLFMVFYALEQYLVVNFDTILCTTINE